jgi:hypothetical protein
MSRNIQAVEPASIGEERPAEQAQSSFAKGLGHAIPLAVLAWAAMAALAALASRI